jgi:hypothetical protein
MSTLFLASISSFAAVAWAACDDGNESIHQIDSFFSLLSSRSRVTGEREEEGKKEEEAG